VGTLTVYFGPNVRYAKYTKAVLAGLFAGYVFVQSAITDGFTSGEWWQLALAVLGAAGVLGVKNVDRKADEVKLNV
jgi:predicted MFS family arabinose efflux permease